MARVCGISSSDLEPNERSEESNTVNKPTRWTCSRETIDNYDRCLYHLTPEQRSTLGINDQDVIKKVRTALTSERSSSDFVGANLPELDLSDIVITGPRGDVFDLRYSTVDGSLDLANSTVELPLKATCMTIGTGGLDLQNTTFKDDVSFHCCRIKGSTDGKGVHFQNEAIFSRIDSTYSLKLKDGATFEQKAVFSNTSISNGGLDIRGAIFRGSVFARNISVPKVNSKRTIFKGFVGFNGAEIDGDAEFSRAHFHTLAAFGDDDIHYSRTSTEIMGTADFSNVVSDRRLSFTKVQFRGGLDLSGGEYNRGVSLRLVSLHDWLNLSNASISHGIELLPQYCKAEQNSAVEVLAVSADIDEGRLSQPGRNDCDRLRYDFTQAVIGDIRFDTATLEGEPYDLDSYNFSPSSLKTIHFARTRFEGFDFTTYRHHLEDDWVLHKSRQTSIKPILDEKMADGGTATESAEVGPNLSPHDKELTYMYAKRGANNIGDNRAASEFFTKEMDARVRRYRAKVSQEGSLWKQRNDAMKYSLYRAWKVVDYTESPLRVVGLSVMTIFAFVAFYVVIAFLTAATFPYPEVNLLIGTLTFSVESFITLVHPPGTIVESTWIRLASVAEGFIGAFLMSLFVFSLTRGVHR